MTIEARRLEDWIGTEVLDSAGGKLGKLEEVYFRGDEPMAVSIRSGLAGRKHHAAVLRDATVGRDSLHVEATAESIVSIDGTTLGAEALLKLSAADGRLHEVRPEQLESWTARAERTSAQARALQDADKLEADAQRHAQQEDTATARARAADREADEARRAREVAEAQAEQARADAQQS